MCGRYALIAKQAELDKEFQLIVSGLSYARYNIAPTQTAPVVRVDTTGARYLVELRWGLVPFWAKDEKIGNRLINARSEEAASKPSFRSPMKKQRCLVPCSGFYEWKVIDGGTPSKPAKQPYFIQRIDLRVFALAGLWDRWNGPDGPVESFTILTTQPNDVLRPLHNRMAIIISHEHYAHWLNPKLQDVNELAPLLVPWASDDLTAFPVGTMVNNPRFDDPACIQPAA